VGGLPAVLTEVRSLLDAAAGDERPPRAVVEHTLTNGYAYVLDLVRTAGAATARARADETLELTRLLGEAARELASVRALLSTLRAQAL
jgi:hypothetical protein